MVCKHCAKCNICYININYILFILLIYNYNIIYILFIYLQYIIYIIYNIFLFYYFITLLFFNLWTHFVDLWTHFWTLYFEGKIRDLKVNIDLYTTSHKAHNTTTSVHSTNIDNF